MKILSTFNLSFLIFAIFSFYSAYSEHFEVAKSLECGDSNCYLEKSVCVQSATTTTKLSCEDYLMFKNAFEKSYCKLI